MPSNKNHFVEFPPHTRFKHLVLRSYLQAWANKQLQQRRLWYVDGFAGRGKDAAGKEGSPLIALSVSNEIRGAGVTKKTYTQLVVRLFETDDDNFTALSSLVPPGLATHGQLASSMDDLDQKIGADPVLYFLDPYGVGLDGTVIQRALAGERREVLMLFHDTGAIRHMGVVGAELSDPEQEIAHRHPDLFPDDEERIAKQLRDAAAKRDAALDTTRPISEAILTKAWGDESWRIHLSFMRDPEKRKLILGHFMERLFDWGARYVLPIPVRNAADQHRYYLLLATHSKAGYRAMKESVESALNKEEIGADATKSLRLEIDVPAEALLRMTEYRFRGQPLVTNDELRDFLLFDTPAYPSSIPAVKLLLKGRKIAGPRHNYDFTS